MKPQIPQITQMKTDERLRTALGIILCGSLGLGAQANEIHVMALSQSAGATEKLPATTYKPIAIAWVHEFAHGGSGPVFQWTAGFITSPNQEASFSSPSAGPWGGASGSYQPGTTFLTGFRMQSRGLVRAGIGFDLRLGVVKESGSSGDTGSSQSKIQFHPWLIAHLRYSPSIGRVAPVAGVHYGATLSDAPYPDKEFGFFAGLRF